MSEDRILQISNDISEQCCSCTFKELIEVVRYWQNRCDQWCELHQSTMDKVILAFTEITHDHLKNPAPHGCADDPKTLTI